MGLGAKKTEHVGPKKKARGAYYGPRAEAKADSNRRRRAVDRVAETDVEAFEGALEDDGV